MDGYRNDLHVEDAVLCCTVRYILPMGSIPLCLFGRLAPPIHPVPYSTSRPAALGTEHHIRTWSNPSKILTLCHAGPGGLRPRPAAPLGALEKGPKVKGHR